MNCSGFSINSISSVNNETYFLSNLDDFSFSCLITVSKISKSMLKKVMRVSIPIPDPKGKAFSFSLLNMIRKAFSLSSLNMMLTMGLFINSLYYVEVHSLYTHFIESFSHICMLNFVKCFFMNLLRWSYDFLSLIWIICCITAIICRCWILLLSLE